MQEELSGRANNRTTSRSITRAACLWVAPTLLSGLALRYLVPGRQEIAPGWWGRFARIADESPLLIAAALVFLFAFLLRRYTERWLHDESDDTDTARPTGSASPDEPALTGVWKVAALVATVGIAALAAFVVRESVGGVYRVTSGSMLPTLAPTDRVLVNKFAYGFHWPKGRRKNQLPRRGYLIVFRASAIGEATEEEVVVKRVIGLPGDRITMDGGLAVINGQREHHCDVGRFIQFGGGGHVVQGRVGVESLGDLAHLALHNMDGLPAFTGYEVGPDEVFVLGDFRNGSRDSRLWKGATGALGAGVPLRAIEGRVWRTLRSDRDGHLDWRGLFRPADLAVHMPGMDTGGLAAGIAQCLAGVPLVSRR